MPLRKEADFHFYGTCVCDAQDAELVKEVLGLIKWVGTMRNRGFGGSKYLRGGSA